MLKSMKERLSRFCRPAINMSLCYVPVHCYLTPDQLTSAFLDAYDFATRLLAGLTKRLRTRVGFGDLGKVVLPPYTAFVEVAECLRREGVQISVNGDALVCGCVPVTADVLAVPWEQGKSLIDRMKEAYVPYHPGSQLLLELIPTHPAFEKKRIDPRLPVGVLELPLYAVTDIGLDLQQKQLLQVSVPTPLGRYDVDEIQLRLMQQLQKCIPQLADYVFEQLEETLKTKELEQRISDFQARAKSLSVPETVSVPDLDLSPGQELTRQLDNFSLELRSDAEKAEDAAAALQHVWTQNEIQAFLQLKPTFSGNLGVVLFSAQESPLPALNIDYEDMTGTYIGSQEELNLSPGENRVLFEVTEWQGRRIVLRETGQKLEV